MRETQSNTVTNTAGEQVGAVLTPSGAGSVAPPLTWRAAALRYALARAREPVTWVSLGFIWNVIQDNAGQLWTLHGMGQVGAAVCAAVMRSPGSPFYADTSSKESVK